MSEYVPDKMSVDGDHSKKVICKFLVSDMWLKPTRHPCEQIWQIPPRFLEMFGVAWKLSLFGIAQSSLRGTCTKSCDLPEKIVERGSYDSPQGIRAKNRAKIPSLEINLSPGPCLGSLGVLRALCQSPCADLVRLLEQDPMEFLQVLSQDVFSAKKTVRVPTAGA